MIKFQHRSLDKVGEMQSGTISAVDRLSAIEELHKKGFIPIEIHQGRRNLSMVLNSEVDFLSQPKTRDVCAFLRDLARLLTAGLSIDEALKLLLTMQQNTVLKQIIEDVREQVRRGENISKSMAAHSKTFPVQITASIKAGENSGSLPDALMNLSTSMERTLEFKEKLKGALIYPAFLVVMVIMTFVLVMTFVLPQFETLFTGNEDKLPMATNFVMGMAAFFTNNALLVSLCAGAFVLGVFYVFLNDRIKAELLKNICRISAVRRWMETPDSIRFIRTLGVCAQSGMALDKSLSMAIEAVKIPHLFDDYSKVRTAVRRGEELAVSLSRLRDFPALALQFVTVGEKSGRLGSMMDEAANILTQEYEARLEKALNILSPTLTMVMGAVVALLVGSILLGIMSINDVAL